MSAVEHMSEWCSVIRRRDGAGPEMPRHEELLQGSGSGDGGTLELQAHTSHARDARCLYRVGLISRILL